MTKPTPETLQSAWKWILDQQCDGSRNIMDGIRKAVENDEEQKHHIGTAQLNKTADILNQTVA